MKGESRSIFKHEQYHTKLRVLYAGSGNIALIEDIGSAGNLRVRGNRGAKEDIAKQCIHK